MTFVAIESSYDSRNRRIISVLASLSIIMVMLCSVFALPSHAAPLAGTSIDNQASATYTDDSNVV